MALSLFMLIIGLTILVKGADFLVVGASSIARKFDVSDLFIGLTIVSFGTSAPELLVNVMSSLKGHADFAFGNVLGSNNFNTLFLLGVTSTFFPLTVQRNTVKYEMPLLIFVTLVLLVLVSDGLWGMPVDQLSQVDAIVLLLFFGVFIGYVYSTRKSGASGIPSMKQYKKIWIAIGAVVLGLGMLFGGGELAITNAIAIAKKCHISDRIIGLTILAIGTSLPELATSLVAIRKKSTGIALGNVIGSNIFNICLVLGFTGLVSPIKYNRALNIDLYVASTSTFALLLFMFTLKKAKLDRSEGLLLLTSYLIYIGYLIYSEVNS